MIFTNLIQANLRTKTFGRQIEYYQRLGSTNVEAWDLIKLGEAENGMIIITDNQFAGKGRNANNWYMSPSKGLAMTLIILDSLPIETALLIPLAAGLATAKALTNRGADPKLKWPNDIFINEKKCGGILCETQISNGIVQKMVIGFGLNINEKEEDLDLTIKEKSTSLSIETGHSNQRELIAAIITTYFEQILDNTSIVQTEWSNYCYHQDKEISFKYNGIVQNGIFRGISSNGIANIEVDNEIREFPSITLNN
tara:strand:- start:1536 stop:2297 length:762 start_codon:yes stop_codon:yes gene_type:complete